MGVAGSAVMDVWSAVLRRRFGIPTLEYRYLGTNGVYGLGPFAAATVLPILIG